MIAQYLVILDNNLVDEPLAPGLPYWTFSIAALPSAQMAARFTEDILFQSELWANDGVEGEWLALRLLECRSMCARCGHIMVTVTGEDMPAFHVVWYIVENRYPEVLSAESYFNSGVWHADYLDHVCSENFFGSRLP